MARYKFTGYVVLSDEADLISLGEYLGDTVSLDVDTEGNGNEPVEGVQLEDIGIEWNSLELVAE